MKVELLAYTPDADKIVSAAAKLCYAKSDIGGLMENLTPDKVEAFLETLTKLGHESPVEHASFTFGIEGVSRALLAQITRHRIASFSVQSQRYVAEHEFGVVLPPEIAAIPEAKAEFEAAIEEDLRHYNKLTDILKAKHKAEMLEAGMDEKAADRAAEKKAIEDARYVLPNACETKMIMTMNARSLHNFFAHRCCNRAQWEIRDVADQMLELVLEVAPHLFKKAGPPCASGSCPEGKMSCGKIKEMREKYANMKNKD